MTSLDKEYGQEVVGQDMSIKTAMKTAGKQIKILKYNNKTKEHTVQYANGETDNIILSTFYCDKL